MQYTLKTVFLTIIAVTLFSGEVLAEKKVYTNLELINLADRQLTRTQRFAKNYFYIHKGISASKAKREQKKAFYKFSETLTILGQSIPDSKIQNMITFVEMSKNSFLSVASKPFTLDNGALILDLSESMLEGSQYILNSLKKGQNKGQDKAVTRLVEMAGKQRVLSQSIAKYYIAYQSGIKDDNSLTQMKRAVNEFSEIQNTLMQNKINSAEINDELNEVIKLWNIVHEFYVNIEQGGLPVIVNNSTEGIRKRMNKVVTMYVDLNK